MSDKILVWKGDKCFKNSFETLDIMPGDTMGQIALTFRVKDHDGYEQEVGRVLVDRAKLLKGVLKL